MAYDRDVIVEFFTNYYALLEKIGFLDPAVIQHPPPDGWSDEQLVVDILRALGRSDRVIDLLRHLPYLRCGPGDPQYRIYVEETQPISYLRDGTLFNGKTAEMVRENGWGMGHLLLMPWADEDCPHTPPGLISLTFGRDAFYWIVDTETGRIYPNDAYLHDEDAADDQPWRQGAKPRNIERYFDEVYWDLYNLKIVPALETYNEPYLAYGVAPEGQSVKRLLTEHGWPIAFRREEYMEALRRARG